LALGSRRLREIARWTFTGKRSQIRVSKIMLRRSKGWKIWQQGGRRGRNGLARCGGELPEAYREPLILRFVEGMSGPEIAARTGLTHGSVRVIYTAGCNCYAKNGRRPRGAREARKVYEKTTTCGWRWRARSEVQRIEKSLAQFRFSGEAPNFAAMTAAQPRSSFSR